MAQIVKRLARNVKATPRLMSKLSSSGLCQAQQLQEGGYMGSKNYIRPQWTDDSLEQYANLRNFAHHHGKNVPPVEDDEAFRQTVIAWLSRRPGLQRQAILAFGRWACGLGD
jgi:hypothetical protein